MADIPNDIAEVLGELTERQQEILNRMYDVLGEARIRELLVEAERRLVTIPAGEPDRSDPKTVQAVLWNMIDDFDPPLRARVLGLPYTPATKPPHGYKRWQILCRRLGETHPYAHYTLRAIIDRVGFDQVEAVATEAEHIEAQGGMLVPDGSRRRTLGGVFFYLLKQQLTPEQRTALFPPSGKPPARSTSAQTATRPTPVPPVAPDLPDRPGFVWAERKGLYQELGPGYTGGTMKITLMGRPGKVIEKQDVVITSITVDKKPALPKGVPAPLPTTYSVYIGRKQWAKVAEAIQNPEDSLIIEGVACYDPAMEGIMVSASTITTRLIQQAKKQSAE